MDTLHLIVLSVIQGLTEFLPVSSSAHLILPSAVLGWPDQGLAFDVAVHVGTLLAVLGYFRQDVMRMIAAWFGSFKGGQTADSLLAWYVIAATVPAGLCGLLFSDFIEQHLRSMVVIAATTMIFGVALGLADWKGRREIPMDKMTFKHALLIGCAQAIAFIPGTSRSGITLTMGLALGLERQAAARFSFLLSIPLIVLSGGYQGAGLLSQSGIDWSVIFWGIVISAVSAALCIHAFLKLLDRIGMWPFVVYRLILGVVLLAIALQ